jgi:general stress protein YciG
MQTGRERQERERGRVCERDRHTHTTAGRQGGRGLGDTERTDRDRAQACARESRRVEYGRHFVVYTLGDTKGSIQEVNKGGYTCVQS